ncbi:amine oxidase [Macroventuria anomochaeta]|uniref:Amine oxidase n=1 Tax=Macroventuria anomochaeta TaxID=301207 RepID=A0ACB6RYP1_9PLEO|nr:amine oxidase [Macroventuria anomochaeta]KAF2627105.1 amine oxidase [Macroventuria anomochaeta]
MASRIPKSGEGYLWSPVGAVEGLETKAAIASPQTCHDSYDIIVIGTGFAGLVAARDISQHSNAKVLLVEARDRIGGRTWTARVAGEDIEMGGTWVHWNQPHVYNELHRYGLHSKLKTSAGTLRPEKQYYKAAGMVLQEVSPIEVNEMSEMVAARMFQIDGHDSRTLMPYPHDPLREPTPWKQYDHLSIRQRLDQLHDIPQADRNTLESLMSSFGSAPGSKIGFLEALRWYALGGHTMAGLFELAGIFKLGGGGMTALALAILSDYEGEVVLNTPVKEIDQDSGGFTVSTRSGQNIRAKSVISTIPLNCLSDIVFNPPLSPLRQQAIRDGHINMGAKIHFKLASIQPGWFAFCESTPTSPYCFAFSDHNGTKTSGTDGTWCIGFGYGGHLTDKTDSKHIIAEVKKNLNPDADVQLYATHDWANDPYAKGAWSCWGPGAMSQYLAELQKPEGRLIFASADWADGWRGFVDGALERGKLAARNALEIVQQKSCAKL